MAREGSRLAMGHDVDRERREAAQQQPDDGCQAVAGRAGPAERGLSQWRWLAGSDGCPPPSEAVPKCLSDLEDPNRPSNLPLAPVTPRWWKRRVGVLVMAAVLALLGLSAWYFKHRVPPSGSGAPGVFLRP
jgi:hypothetical protein